MGLEMCGDWLTPNTAFGIMGTNLSRPQNLVSHDYWQTAVADRKLQLLEHTGKSMQYGYALSDHPQYIYIYT